MFLLDGCPSINSSRFYTWTFIFLVYINDLPNNLTSNRKLFANDTSLFSTVVDLNATANQINNDLHNNNKCAYQWKMNFKREVIFSRKIKVTAQPQLLFNNYPVHEPHLKRILEYFSNSS